MLQLTRVSFGAGFGGGGGVIVAVVADGVTAVLETRPAFPADCAVHLVHGADRARLEHPTRSAKCLISGALAAEPVFTVPTSVDRIASDRHRTRALVACRGAL